MGEPKVKRAKHRDELLSCVGVQTMTGRVQGMPEY